jgi:hypothetical protein
MKIDWLNLGGHDMEYQTVLDRLNASPYDELLEIDVINDRCRSLWHVQNKYYLPMPQGNWSELYRYCADHMVHPQDRELYCALMDPDTVLKRLEQSAIPGVLSEELRYRQAEQKCFRVLCDYLHLLERWEKEYAPQTPEEAWNPLFVEALQKKPYTEYLLDILLSGSMEERACVVAEYGKEVRKIEQRISEFTASHPAGRHERSRSLSAGAER